MDNLTILNAIKSTIDIEYKCIYDLKNRIDEHYLKAIDLIYKCKGRVIFLGTGKSGIIAKKIASTFSSIGTPSVFIHPSDAAHGDLGAFTKNDVAFIISNSGKTEEIVLLIPILKRFGISVISIVGNRDSELYRVSDVTLDGSVRQEASPIDLVPTSSTTVALVIGDALSSALVVKRGFSNRDFGLFHPGGVIGRKLITKVGDLMHLNSEIPVVKSDDHIEKILYEISSKRLGMTVVMNNTSIYGIITDGDLRRAFGKYKKRIFDIVAKDIMTENPKSIHMNAFALEAANIMETSSITSLIVVDNKGLLKGVIHLHDILKTGIL